MPSLMVRVQSWNGTTELSRAGAAAHPLRAVDNPARLRHRSVDDDAEVAAALSAATTGEPDAGAVYLDAGAADMRS